MAWPPTTHQDVQDEVSGLRLRSGPTIFLPTPGTYFSVPQQLVNNSTRVLNQNQLVVQPFYLARRGKLVSVNHKLESAGVAGTQIRWALYADDGTGLPAAMTHDLGTGSSGPSFGINTHTLATPVTLEAGTHWLALCYQGSATTVTAWGASTGQMYVRTHATPDVQGQIATGGPPWYNSSTAYSGALPATLVGEPLTRRTSYNGTGDGVPGAVLGWGAL